MNKFVHDENIKLFRKRLAETTDPEQRRVLLRLLAEEEANGECETRLQADRRLATILTARYGSALRPKSFEGNQASRDLTASRFFHALRSPYRGLHGSAGSSS